jgi:hypothetical protein
MDVQTRIKRSLEYGALDHKWLARNQLGSGRANKGLRSIALSSFDYFDHYFDALKSDRSLAAITSLCNDEDNQLDVDAEDPNVMTLSTAFNEMVGSNRKVFKCYDCGTNARAIFLTLIKAARLHGSQGLNVIPITPDERSRMMKEYLLNTTDPVRLATACLNKLLTAKKDIVFIMSVSVEDFGHVWVIEKRFFKGKPRYHHYQSSLSSHLLIDFIEAMDYGRDPMQSIDIEEFMNGVIHLMGIRREWKKTDLLTFVRLFRFIPLRKVTDPKPGFCYTWIEY